jgi:hypothetical protein
MGLESSSIRSYLVGLEWTPRREQLLQTAKRDDNDALVLVRGIIGTQTSLFSLSIVLS